MRVKSLYLKNMKPIYRGSGKREIYIDFMKCKHNTILIVGPNGSGKSTIMDALQPLPESPSMFLEHEEGMKIIEYLSDDILYEVKIIYPVSNTKQRTQTKAFLKKVFQNGSEIELNPNGNIGSYKDALYSEFKLDPNFISLSQLSTEDRGIVEKTPSDRKKYVGSILDEIQVYNDIHKAIVKRSSIFKSMINSITAKINSIGKRDILEHELNSIESSMNVLQNSIDKCSKIISDNESMIRVIDPDGSIQQRYAQLNSEKIRINDKIKSIQILMSKYISKYPDVDKVLDKKSNLETSIRELDNHISRVQDRLSELLITQEENYKSLQIKQQKVQAMRSQFVIQDLKESIFSLNNSIAGYKAVFDQIGITDLSITKNEYVIGLNTLKDLRDMVMNMRSYASNESIQNAIDLIYNNEDIFQIKRNNLNTIEMLENQIQQTKQDISYFKGLIDISSILDQRPPICEVDDCPFISNALEASKKEPQRRVQELSLELEELEKDLRDNLNKKEEIEELLNTYQTIQNIIRNIQNNRSIIEKLPNGDIFGDKDKFLTAILNGSNFNEINQLYQYIQRANIFESYQNDKERLTKLEYEYKLHENKIEMIEEIDQEIKDLQQKLDSITEKVVSYQSEIKYNKMQKEEDEQELQKLVSIKEMYDQIQDLQFSKQATERGMEKLVGDMKVIEESIRVIADTDQVLLREKSDLIPLQQKRDDVKFSLNKLNEYEEELKVYNSKYNTIELIKKYSSPTKGGIQTLFMKLYMSKTLEITNELLSYLFQGELQLLPYIINDNEFRIPCKNINSSVVNDDISSCSSAEKSMISMILSFALLKQSSTKYNILKMDEMDGALDQYNRSNFLTVLDIIMEKLEVENCFLVSHSSEIDMSNVDIVLLSDHNDYGYQDNVIFSYSE